MSKRDQDRNRKKKERRQRRQEKRSWARPARPPQVPALDQLIRTLEAHNVPMPSRWPGASDPSLERPDLVKFELAEFACRQQPGKSKLRQLEDGLSRGLIDWLPELDHWAIEEFLWHGLPGDPWQPVEAFLEQQSERFPQAAKEQLRRWKEAQLGFFEIGEVRDETVVLQEWDPIAKVHAGPPRRAITFNIGGVNYYKDKGGRLNLTYLAPWVPAEGLYCGLGYGTAVEKGEEALLLLYLALRHPEIVARPLPWRVSLSAKDDYLRQWRKREWQEWFAERLQFPFMALVGSPPDGRPVLRQVMGLIPSKPDYTRQFGIYFEIPLANGEMMAPGATMVQPLDPASPNMAALAEYKAYRDEVGPPPGTIGQPAYFSIPRSR
jgi:hypothetical protein